MTTQPTLLDDASPRRHLIEEVAQELTGRPGAHLARITRLTLECDGFDGVKVEVVDAPPCQAGKRTGQPNWRKATNRQPLIVAWDDWQAAIVAWEQRNGLCSGCVGTGEEFFSWSATDGVTYRQCHDCGGTGTPNAELADRWQREREAAERGVA